MLFTEHIVELVEECMEALSVVSYVHEDLAARKRDIWIIDITNLENLRLAVRVLGHHIELKGRIVGSHTDRSILRPW